jgi:dTDP-4-amino-4,6-dideoxygalactose transaminase
MGWALRAAKGAYTQLIAPAYTCHAVHEALSASTAHIRLLDAAPDSFLVDSAALVEATTERSAVVLCELYGHTYDLAAWSGFPEHTPAFRVVDMAMTVPGAQVCDRLTGNDCGIFSFGLGKCVYSGWGGMAVTRDKALAQEIRGLRNAALRQPGFFFPAQRAVSVLLRTLAHEAWLYRWVRPEDRPCTLSSPPWVTQAITPHWSLPSTYVDRKLIAFNLKHASDQASRRQQLAQRYHHNLDSVAGIIRPKEETSALSHYTILVGNGQRDLVRRRLWKAGFDAGAIFHSRPYLSPTLFSNAFHAAACVLNLPLSPTVRDADVDRICEVVAKSTCAGSAVSRLGLRMGQGLKANE